MRTRASIIRAFLVNGRPRGRRLRETSRSRAPDLKAFLQRAGLPHARQHDNGRDGLTEQEIVVLREKTRREHPGDARGCACRKQEAEPLIEAAVARTPDAVGAVADLALLRALQGRHPEAQALVPRLLSIAPRNRTYHHITYNIARVYALGGRVDEAARWPNETVDGGFPCYPLLASDAFLDPVRSAPRIQALLVRLRAQSDAFRVAAGSAYR